MPLRFVSLVLLAVVSPLAGQQVYPTPAGDDVTGFSPIFDGKTLDGWEGDPVYWRVENGCLVGEVTPETLLKQNSFIIWRGGMTGDFELKVEYRVSDKGNSGINYRSLAVEGQSFALRGYQADIDGADKYTGQNYEERGRTFLALRGDISRADPDGKARIIGSVGDKDVLAAFIRKGDWNEVHLVVRGNTMIHMANGHVMSVVVDDDPERRRMNGLLGVQVHVGPPMKIEYRNFRLKKLVPAAHCKPVFLPNDRTGNDTYPGVCLSYQLAYNCNLLKIFLSEKCNIRFYYLEQP